MTGLLSLRKIQGYLPFSYPNIFKHLLDKNCRTILDIGTGDGYLMQHINYKKRYEVTGIEPYKPFKKLAEQTGAYNKILAGKAQDLKYPPKSFDLVMSSQVMDYLTKKEGLKFIEKCKKIAKRQTIIAVYIGDPNHKAAEGNPFQTSKSYWFPKDLQKLGFKVYGQGLRLVYRENGYNPKKLTFRFLLPIIFSYIMSPLVYIFPFLASQMVGVYNKYDTKNKK